MEGKARRIKCSDCLNYMMVTYGKTGDARGFCQKCNAAIITKQSSARERLIRIVKAEV